MRTVERLAWVGAIILVAAVLASCTAEGSSSSDAAATTQPPAEAGLRFDGSDLPEPVSSFYVMGDLLGYYTASDRSQLELVAVDPDTAEVRWTRPAAVSWQPPGVSLSLDGIGDAVAILAHPDDDPDGFVIEFVGPDGSARWTQEVNGAEGQPEACGDRICVETDVGNVSFATEDGSMLRSAPLPSWTQVVAFEGDDALAVETVEEASDPSIAIHGRPLFDEGASWTQPLDELFGDQQVTSTMGWAGYRYDDSWVLWLGNVLDFEGDEPEYPYERPPGSVAGFAVADGAPAWLREQVSVCFDLTTDNVVVLCESKAVWTTADAVGTNLVSSVEKVDPTTGENAFTVEFSEPAELFAPSDWLMAVAPDRWIMRDGEDLRMVDFVAETDGSADADSIGWCKADTEIAEVVDPDGEPTSYADPGYLYPCTLVGDQPSDDAVAGAIVDGDIQVTNETAVEVGQWTVWVEDGHLTGVARPA